MLHSKKRIKNGISKKLLIIFHVQINLLAWLLLNILEPFSDYKICQMFWKFSVKYLLCLSTLLIIPEEKMADLVNSIAKGIKNFKIYDKYPLNFNSHKMLLIVWVVETKAHVWNCWHVFVIIFVHFDSIWESTYGNQHIAIKIWESAYRNHFFSKQNHISFCTHRKTLL